MRKHIHYGVIVERPSTPAEIKTAKAWLVSNPEITRELFCAKCGEKI